jgi:hypothetical protein
LGRKDLCVGKALKMKTFALRRLGDKDLYARKISVLETYALRRCWRRRP